MTRATSKTIDFDFDFTYSRGGNFHSANQITVCEPNYDKRDVYRTMRGYLGEAEKGLMKLFSDMPVQQKSDAAPEPSDTSGSESEPDLLEQMRLTLGVEGYSKFCDYVQRQITGHLSLCYIGNADTPLPERFAVNDAVWGDIAAKGGMEQIDRVLTAFGSFFTSTSKAKGQTATPGTTSSSPPAPSQTGRSRSRQQN